MDAEKIVRQFNNVEWDGDGNPLYSYEQMINAVIAALNQKQVSVEDTMATSISDFLINNYMFVPITASKNDEKIDVDKFSCILRVHEIHYLFYSEVYKAFSIGVRHENPKGLSGGGLQYWTTVMIPKVIRTTADAKAFIDRMIENK